jgi:hypothetical protein
VVSRGASGNRLPSSVMISIWCFAWRGAGRPMGELALACRRVCAELRDRHVPAERSLRRVAQRMPSSWRAETAGDLGGVGHGRMAAVEASNRKPDLGRRGVAERHRRAGSPSSIAEQSSYNRVSICCFPNTGPDDSEAPTTPPSRIPHREYHERRRAGARPQPIQRPDRRRAAARSP